MIHLFKSAVSRAVTYGLITLLVAGLLVGAVRLALPFADLFRSELEGLLSETLGLEVRVGRLGVRLAGWVPRLTLLDAELVDPESGRTQLSLKQLRLDLDLLATGRGLSPKIRSITLVGASLVIRRLTDGSIRVSGLEGMQAGDPEAVTFFLGSGRFLLTQSDVYWVNEQTGAPPLHLANVQMRFDNTGDRHRIGLRAELFGDARSSVRLTGDLKGAPDEPTDWHGALYLHWKGRDLGRVLRGRLPHGVQLVSSGVEIESWTQWQGRSVARSLDRIDLKGLKIWKQSADGIAPPLHIERLEGLVRWRPQRDGWRLEVADLVLARGGVERPATDLGLSFFAGEEAGWSLTGGGGLLSLRDAGELLTLLPEDLPDAVTRLRDVRLDGEVRDLRFRVSRDGNEARPRWAAQARLEDLSFDPHARLPGLRGLSARLAADESSGTAILDAEGAVFTMPRLFRGPFILDRVAGSLRWWRDGGGALHVEAPDLLAENAHIATRSRLGLTLSPAGGSPFLDLHTELRDADVAAVHRYLPVGRLKERLVRWLDRALVSGRVPAGAFLFRGSLADFPFAENQGRFEVLFGVEDAILDYHRDWPRLEELDAEVRFLNSGLEIDLASGRMLESELLGGSAGIPNLFAADAVQIASTVEGPFADGLRVLAETPIKRTLGRLAAAFRAEGASRLDLDLTIPLRRKEQERRVPLQVRGELSWPEQASLTIPDWDLELTELAGSLSFTEGAVSAEAIQARVWDTPVRIRIDRQGGGQAADSFTRIRVDGTLSKGLLVRRLPSPLWDLVKGRTRASLRLDLRNADVGSSDLPLDFALETNLRGVAVDLPAPLGKAASGTRKLRLTGRLAPKDDLGIRGGYGELALNLRFARDSAGGGPRLARGALSLGGRVPPLPRREGLHLTGALGRLDLPAWLNWWGNRQGVDGGGTGGGIALGSADVRVQHLLLTDMACNDVHLDLKRRGRHWHAKLSARELAGELRIPHRPRREPIQIHLDRLDLKGVLGHEGEEGQALDTGKQRSDPRTAHTLDLRVEELRWGDNPLGSILVRSRPRPDGLEFTDLDLTGPFMSIQGQASWTLEEGSQQTALSLAGEGSDLGAFLRSLEYESLLYKAPATADLELQWPGGPAQFSVADLSGRLEANVGAGSLLEVEPGVGRMLGILNLGALQRRLSLDFSDLFERGYAFEKITGVLAIRDGEATIETLVIDGPSASVGIVGSTDLVKQRFDQVMTVTPRIGTSVAVASAVAGGPLVGAAVLLADRVSGGAVDRLGSYQYRISGPWADPDIRRGGKGKETGTSDTEASVREGASVETEQARRGEAQETRTGKPAHAPSSRAPRQRGRPSSEQNLFLDDY
ncbi:MAG: YhdP family protein [Pseudomonadota bacterium]|nr:YhdP family protein [Pseudomonadota bacterium]